MEAVTVVVPAAELLVVPRRAGGFSSNADLVLPSRFVGASTRESVLDFFFSKTGDSSFSCVSAIARSLPQGFKVSLSKALVRLNFGNLAGLTVTLRTTTNPEHCSVEVEGEVAVAFLLLRGAFLTAAGPAKEPAVEPGEVCSAVEPAFEEPSIGARKKCVAFARLWGLEP